MMRTILLVIAVIAVQIGLFLYLGSLKEPEPRRQPGAATIAEEVVPELHEQPVTEDADPEPEPKADPPPSATELVQKAIGEIIEACDGTLAVFHVRTGFRIIRLLSIPS